MRIWDAITTRYGIGGMISFGLALIGRLGDAEFITSNMGIAIEIVQSPIFSLVFFVLAFGLLFVAVKHTPDYRKEIEGLENNILVEVANYCDFTKLRIPEPYIELRMTVRSSSLLPLKFVQTVGHIDVLHGIHCFLPARWAVEGKGVIERGADGATVYITQPISQETANQIETRLKQNHPRWVRIDFRSFSLEFEVSDTKYKGHKIQIQPIPSSIDPQ